MLSGGRLLDQGFYGCVFVPSLTCQSGTEVKLDKDKDSDTMSQLSKLIPTEDAEQEFHISKRIHRIPFYKQYFGVAESICAPAVKQREKDLPACEALEDSNLAEMRLLRMPYQGKALYHVQFSAASFDLRAFAVHLLGGGALMNLFGIVHRDLHQGNILVDSSYVPRIIDFNLSFTVRTPPSHSDLSHKYEYTIAHEPPDSTLINAIAHGHSANQVIQAIAFRKPIIQKIISLVGGSKRDVYQSLMDYYKKSKVMRAGDTEKWFTLHYRVIDSWAIGICLVDLILKLSLWPSFASRIQDTVKVLVPLLRRMCEVNPMKRIDCVQALHGLDPNHIIIRRYGAKWLDIVGRS